MHKYQILPYFHPSTVVFVDDNHSFLEGLKLSLAAELACEMYTDPVKALKSINNHSANPPLADRCFSLYTENHIPGGTAIYLDLSLIEQEISKSQRFALPSVVIVDYDMPMMNGLEFCAQIKDRKIQRILLTGVADEQVAIEAFNAGLIDRFIRKNHDHALEIISAYIAELQIRYFVSLVDKLKASLSMQTPEFLLQAPVHNHLTEILTHKQTREYYMVSEPPGFLLLTSAGSVQRLILQDDELISQNLQYAINHHAPASIIEALQKKQALAFFYQAKEPYNDEEYPWQDFIFPATQIENSSWHIAFDNNPPIDIEYQASHASYNTYLKGLDENQPAPS